MALLRCAALRAFAWEAGTPDSWTLELHSNSAILLQCGFEYSERNDGTESMAQRLFRQTALAFIVGVIPLLFM